MSRTQGGRRAGGIVGGGAAPRGAAPVRAGRSTLRLRRPKCHWNKKRRFREVIPVGEGRGARGKTITGMK